MVEFTHRLITFEELNDPDLRAVMNNKNLKCYLNNSFDNDYFLLIEILALLRTVLGEVNTEKLLKDNCELTLQLFTELCVDIIKNEEENPPKDLQMSFFFNYIKGTAVKGAGNNLKLYRKLIRKAVESFELDETFSAKLQEELMDRVKLPTHLFILRFN